MQGFGEVSAKKRCEGAGGAAAGAQDVEVSEDGATGIEGVLIGGEAQQDCS